MKLYFVRHGEAEDLAPTDHSRELTERGKQRVSQSAQVLKQLGITLKAIYSSPRIRAKQTATLIAEALELDVTITEEVNFGFDLSNLKLLTKKLKSGDGVMFVGHNPDMSQIVHKMTGASVSMKKGGLARIDVVNHKTRRGELVWLIAPKVFDVLYNQPATTDLQQLLSNSEPLEIESAINNESSDE
jgi:phosphohistidine phosphatase